MNKPWMMRHLALVRCCLPLRHNAAREDMDTLYDGLTLLWSTHKVARQSTGDQTQNWRVHLGNLQRGRCSPESPFIDVLDDKDVGMFLRGAEPATVFLTWWPMLYAKSLEDLGTAASEPGTIVLQLDPGVCDQCYFRAALSAYVFLATMVSVVKRCVEQKRTWEVKVTKDTMERLTHLASATHLAGTDVRRLIISTCLADVSWFELGTLVRDDAMSLLALLARVPGHESSSTSPAPSPPLRSSSSSAPPPRTLSASMATLSKTLDSPQTSTLKRSSAMSMPQGTAPPETKESLGESGDMDPGKQDALYDDSTPETPLLTEPVSAAKSAGTDGAGTDGAAGDPGAESLDNMTTEPSGEDDEAYHYVPEPPQEAREQVPEPAQLPEPAGLAVPILVPAGSEGSETAATATGAGGQTADEEPPTNLLDFLDQHS